MVASHYRNSSCVSVALPVETNNDDDDDDVDIFLAVLHKKYNFPMPSDRVRELPYVEKLRSLLKSDPLRIHDALDMLEIWSQESGKRLRGKGGTEKLLIKFDQILELELSQSADFSSDRDTSILPLINWDKYQATSSGRQDHQGRSSLLAENEDIEAGEGKVAGVDSDDSDDSFHSCLGTPSPPNRIQKRPVLDTNSSYSSSSSSASAPTPNPRENGNQTAQRPNRMANIYPDLESLQKTSRLRSSRLGGNSGYDPPLPKQTIGTSPGTHRSFNTSGGSDKVGKDCSSPKSPDASFDKTQIVGSSANKSRARALRQSTIVGQADDRSFMVETEAIYNRDLDGESPDNDDVEIDPVTARYRLSVRTRKNEPPLVELIRNGGSEYMAMKDDDAVEADFQRRATAFFEDSVSYPDSPVIPGNASSNRGGGGGGGGIFFDEDEEEAFNEVSGPVVDDWLNNLGTSRVTRQEEEEGERGEGVSFAVSGRDRDVRNDDHDEDEYGTIDASFEDEVMNLLALSPAAHPLPTLHFAVQYEATRVALNRKIQSSSAICAYLNSFCDDLFSAEEYSDVWKTLTRFWPGAENLEKTNEAVWRNIKNKSGWPDNAYLTGSVRFATPKMGSESKIPLDITLNPLLRTRGNRFFNRFGSDRFLALRLPSFQKLSKDDSEKALARIIHWLVEEEMELLNRRWKCFYIKDRTTRKKNDMEKYFNQAIFFATEGVGIGEGLDEQELNALGFKNDSRKLRHKMSAHELLEWHIPLQGKNLKQTVSKFWSRISLGFSDTTPTVTINPSQIEHIRDLKSPTDDVMDDGCSIISPALMKMIRQKIGSDLTPTAVQGRIGGAKGIWMVDPDGDWSSEELYLKVKESQRKYEGLDNDDDWAKLTIDVLASSHDPTPATINTQLIPILADRGVPFSVMKELLEEHLEGDLNELFQIIDEPVQLRKWLYSRGGLARERISSKTVATCGALPANKLEIAILLLESGFSVRGCEFLREIVRQYIDQHCKDLKTKLHIRIPRSTRLFCVADPTRTLKEGEVSLRFSNGILDLKTMRRQTVILGDILVARNPAHLPSDIQKVQAVDIRSPKLKDLQDVIVFSVQGNKSLASLLSGGDYDGDKPWVCWDERVVGPFKNSDQTYDEERELILEKEFKPSDKTMEDLEPHQPGFFNRFLRAGVESSLQENFLGICTSAWERFCYQNEISDPRAIRMAILCSFLVDAPKQGLSILPSTKEQIIKILNRFPLPAYKEPQSRGVIFKNSTNVIDQLHFVAEQKVEEMKTAFHDDFGKTERHEVVLTELYHIENELAGGKAGGPLGETLRHLRNEFRILGQSWPTLIEKYGFVAAVSSSYSQFREIMPPEDLLKDPVISRLVLNADSPLSYWSLLRASTAYYVWHKRKLVWYMAGRELCFIKSQAIGRKSEFGPRTMIEEMYIPLKTIGRYQGIKKTDHDDDEEEDNDGEEEDNDGEEEDGHEEE